MSDPNTWPSEAWQEIERLEAENAKLREVVQIAQELVDDYTIVDNRLKAALLGAPE